MKIKTGKRYLEAILGSDNWYWTGDNNNGELYEMEEAFKLGKPFPENNLLLVHYPSGKAVVALEAEKGQYFGSPRVIDGVCYLLAVNFIDSLINIYQFDIEKQVANMVVQLPLSEVKDCYNLQLDGSPVMLTRQAFHEDKFEIIWPQKKVFETDAGFSHRKGGTLYFSNWLEDPDYREVVSIVDFETGELLEEVDGYLRKMPNGEVWLLE